jgi:hypothetical protein
MGKMEYLAMKTDYSGFNQIGSDLNELGPVVHNLANHAFHLAGGLGLGFGSVLLQWLASLAAM